MSVEIFEVTKAEVKALLENLGCLVLLENTDGTEILKCYFEDHSGASLRPVKFKVELLRQNNPTHEIQTSSGITHLVPKGNLGHQTCVVLTVERGSVPSFKFICNELRKSWDLDMPTDSPVGLGVSMDPPVSPHSSSSGKARNRF